MTIEGQLDAMARELAELHRDVQRISTPIVPLAYRLNDAAAALGVSRSVLDRMIAAGHLEAVILPTMEQKRIPAWSLARLVGDPTHTSHSPGLRAVN